MTPLFTPPDNLLLAFDGYNVVRRVYGAVPGDDSVAKVEGAFKSSLGSFKRALKEFKPTHVLAAFDAGGKTFRHDIYPHYREARQPMPEVLRAAMPAFFDMLRDEGIPVVVVPGVEADDVLGTVGFRWVSGGKGRAVIMSTDKDLADLGQYGVEVRDQFMERWLDAAWIMTRGGVQPSQYTDYLALTGDIVDGIPGINKCGPKTAAKWLGEYGSLAGLIENRMKLTGAIGIRFQETYQDALMSRELVRLKLDVEVGVSWRDLEYAGPSK